MYLQYQYSLFTFFFLFNCTTSYYRGFNIRVDLTSDAPPLLLLLFFNIQCELFYYFI